MTEKNSLFTIQNKYAAVLLFGPPGSGKGTMGKFLAGTKHHYHLSSGDIYRSIAPESPAGKVLNDYMSKGLLLPNDQALAIWKYYVDGLVATNQYFPHRQLLLLDGMPRTPEQAHSLDQYVDVQQIISLEIPNENELFQRIQGRAKEEGRADDMSEEVFATRMQVYRKETEKMLAHYPKESIHSINAQQPLFEVLRDLLIALAPHLKPPL